MKISKILVPIDFTESCVHALQAAKIIADRSQSEIHLIHYCISLASKEHVPLQTEETVRSKRHEMEKFIKAHCELYSNRLVTSSGSVGFEYDVVFGMAGDEIPQYVNQKNIDLIIMGRRSKHDALDKFLGSVSSAVIENAACPILLIPMPCDLQQVRNIAFCSHEDSISADHLQYVSYWSELFRSSIHYIHLGMEEDRGEKLFEKIRDNLRHSQRVPLDYRFANLNSQGEEELNRYAASHQIDLFVTVHHKRSLFESIFHRSFTLRLSHVVHSPLLVIH
ncbi:MAG: universal stress protein [Saprospiraceae bacterium]|nr:universal stress protein [Saprospiraceae bacterium]HMW39874.1 universal stress protein [Saprospiraceae bacterium]HMX88294.1 universal stress protein [Saprospiraceae bacterium]HMZ40422.1 universal stress protein [Saprospiraceae bacterium]HNA65025.1 universal stress protein [Saprospiraceae bacterium]